jgi:Spy/CpxP family protein refolding chaperone
MLGMRSKATLYLALIFLCGVGSGVVGTRMLNRASVSADTQAPPSTPTASTTNTPSHKVRGAVRSFTRHLDLTNEQALKLTMILEETRAEYKEHELQIESIRQHGNARIREILDPQQKIKFDELLARRADRDRRRNDDQRNSSETR